MICQQLNDDCIGEISRHLNVTSWHNFRRVSKNIKSIMSYIPLSSLTGVKEFKCGKRTVNGKVYPINYIGEYINNPKFRPKNKSLCKKPILKHGLGIMTISTGKNTRDIIKGEFSMNQLKNHVLTHENDEYIIGGGPYKGDVVEATSKTVVNHNYPVISINKCIRTVPTSNGSIYTYSVNIKIYKGDNESYTGGWLNGKPHGVGIMTKSHSGLSYGSERGTWVNGVKHGLFEIRSLEPYPKLKRTLTYVNYKNGVRSGEELMCSYLRIGSTSKQTNIQIYDHSGKAGVILDSIIEGQCICPYISLTDYCCHKIPTAPKNPFKNDYSKCGCHYCHNILSYINSAQASIL